MIKIKFFVLALFIAFFSSCEDEAGKGSKTSTNGNTDSHNVGTACLGCHNSGGKNEFWFSIAGTVYRADIVDLYPDCIIFLFQDNLGATMPVYTLYGDAKANFYTTEIINFGSGLYPAVKSKAGTLKIMNTSVNSGDCNACHVEGNRIYIDEN